MQVLTRERFDALLGSTRSPWTRIVGIEKGWYSEKNEKVLCVIVQDTSDRDFTCIVLGRDLVGRFRAVYLTPFFKTLKAARSAVPGLLSTWSSRDEEEYSQGDEPKKRMDFFAPLHPVEKLHPDFNSLISDERLSAARGIIDSMMSYFKDPDGNFVEQFQSTAFNARLWELYLFAVLAEERCEIDRSHPAPDYLFTAVFGECFLEAVTANPSGAGETGYPTAPNKLYEYMHNYLPMKFSGPLVSKLGKHYWEKPYIRDRPIILAIADYHLPDSMQRSQDALLEYLYGQRFEREYDKAGRLSIKAQPLAEHVWFGKRVPSGFFQLSGAEHISAVISTGEDTIMKFNRMGHRAGFGSARIKMAASGWRCIHGHPARVAPVRFKLDVNSDDYEEFWIDGLQVYHNPRARNPLDIRLFADATHRRWRDGQLDSTYADRSPNCVETHLSLSSS